MAAQRALPDRHWGNAWRLRSAAPPLRGLAKAALRSAPHHSAALRSTPQGLGSLAECCGVLRSACGVLRSAAEGCFCHAEAARHSAAARHCPPRPAAVMPPDIVRHVRRLLCGHSIGTSAFAAHLVCFRSQFGDVSGCFDCPNHSNNGWKKKTPAMGRRDICLRSYFICGLS